VTGGDETDHLLRRHVADVGDIHQHLSTYQRNLVFEPEVTPVSQEVGDAGAHFESEHGVRRETQQLGHIGPQIRGSQGIPQLL
jgi:hypothetical protein